jgi:6-phosphogluconolactonase
MNLRILPTPMELAWAAAELFVAKSSEAVAQRGVFTVALAGGSTPELFYQMLAQAGAQFRPEIYWPMIDFFWTDERHVPPNHPTSNYRMAFDKMLSRVPVSRDKIHRIRSENPNAEEAAQAYEETVMKFVPGNMPRLDLVLLGLGTDGHTASIFPDSDVLHESQRLVAASYVDKLKSYRITMTLPLINNAASIVFLVSGVEKAEIVKEVIQGTKRYPAQEIRPTNGELVWLLDREAASKL